MAALGVVVEGYRRAPSHERAAFAFSWSYATTVATARAINYWRERRRRMPLLRSLARRAMNAPRRSGRRVHHFVPGFALAFASGGASIASRDDGRESWFAVPFGVGAALTLDELALLLGEDNAYWRSERFAIGQAAAAAVGAALLGAGFTRV